MAKSGPLAVILATPPLRTSGRRTVNRVRLAAHLLGFESICLANLLNVPGDDVLAMAVDGADGAPWAASRRLIRRALERSDGALFAWGVTEPAGPARSHFRQQVRWVTAQTEFAQMRVWTVGGTPRHPSRWQRHTAEAMPDAVFAVALRASLVGPAVAEKGR